jgi:hypothetical protein
VYENAPVASAFTPKYKRPSQDGEAEATIE